MSSLIRVSKTRKNNPAVTDVNNFQYVKNFEGRLKTNWRCSIRKCGATITTRNSTGNLVGEELPTHDKEDYLSTLAHDMIDKE